MAISANQVKELREATGAGVLECRKALEALVIEEIEADPNPAPVVSIEEFIGKKGQP